MPDATITSTASTFGTISGVFSADQSTISGTISGVVPGTLTGSVGVPGPAGAPGVGVPAGGTAGQYLQKTTTGVDYATDWVTLNLSAYAPLNSPAFTGNPTAPTAVLGDNDTSLATTAFVQQELASGVAVAKNLEVYVRNQSGSTIPAGSIVYISGATGNRPLISLAQANNDANSAQTMGFTKESIANNGFGYVIVRGELENIDTSALTEGVQLYLSPTTAGTWTTTKPSAPQHLVYVGIVVRAHPTQGIILVAVQNGYELNELHDVKITSASNGQVLKYDSAQGLWVNGTDVGGVAWGGITGSLSSQLDLDSALSGKLSLLGGTIADACLVNFLSSAADSTVVIGAGEVKISSNTLSTDFSSVQYNSVTVQDTSGSTIHTATGIVFADATFQSTAYAPADVLQKSNNLSEITATASTARTNLGLGTMAVETASNYLTTASASSTYFTIASAANKADLASPTFTGTPTLPTGTIGVTQSPGNNTTALATTAFVTAAVPAFASTAQVVAATSTTTALAPSNQGFLLTNPRLQSLAFFNGTSASGSGLAPTGGPQNFSRQVYLNSLAVGRAAFLFGVVSVTNAGFGTSTAKADQVDFSKKVWISGYACMGWTGGTSYIGDANTICRITLGGYSTNTTGDMTLKGIGLKKVGGTSSFVTLTVHNGTTRTDVASTVTVPDGGGIHWQIYSDGTGNVTLYINGTQAATTTAGPTTATASGQSSYREQVEAVATPGVRQVMNCNGGWFYTE